MALLLQGAPRVAESASGPLPTAGAQRPAALFVLDRSGSMNACDAGTPAGMDPADYNCSSGANRTTRLLALQYAMFRILDANGDNTIDAADEQVLGIDVGVVAFDSSFEGGVYATRVAAAWPVGTPYQNIWCGTDGAGGPAMCDHNSPSLGNQGFANSGVCTLNTSGSEIPGIQDLSPCAGTPTSEAMLAAFAGTQLLPQGQCGATNYCCWGCDGAATSDGNGSNNFIYGLMNGCYDNRNNAFGGSDCFLSPLDANDADAAQACRKKFMIVLTDGGHNGPFHPHDVSDALISANAGAAQLDGVFGIALGSGADIGEMNCLAREGQGSFATDANLDGDNDYTTPACTCDAGADNIIGDASAPSGGTCGDPGNSYQANNADQLAAVFQQIVNQINTGTFSRTEPSISVPPVSTSSPTGTRVVHAATFDVQPNLITWQGKTYKYLTGSDSPVAPTYTGLLDCPCQGAFDHPNCTSGPPHVPDEDLDADPTTGVDVDGDGNVDGFDPVPCYEAGAALEQAYQAKGIKWSQRNLFVTMPTDATFGDSAFTDFDQEAYVMGIGTGEVNPSSANLASPTEGGLTATQGPPMYLDSYTALANLSDANLATLTSNTTSGTWDRIADIPPNSTLQKFAMLAFMLNRAGQVIDTNTDLSDLMVANPNYWFDARESMRFNAGNPQALSADGRCRAVNVADCTGNGTAPGGVTDTSNDGVPGYKMTDIFESDPILIPPPPVSVPDPDFNQFLRCDGTAALCDVDEDGDGTPDFSYFPVTGCADGSSTCPVQDRVRMLYVSSNDGWIHAFLDEEVPVSLDVPGSTGPRIYDPGEEVWAMSLAHMLSVHGRVQSGHTIAANNDLLYRDVKFSHAGNGHGRWATVISVTYRQGGASTALIDVTDPIAPKLVWEYRKPKKMGNTFAAPSLGVLPPDDVNGRSFFEAMLFMPGGQQSIPGEHVHYFTIPLHDPSAREDKHLPNHNGAEGLEVALTDPPGIELDLAARTSMADLNFDGVTEVGYFGDTEGRVWKVCNIDKDGKFDNHVFADPAFWMNVPPQPSAGDYEASNPTGGNISDRGSIYYRPAVAFGGQNQSGDDDFIVAFGSGDVTDPLNTTSTNENYIYTYVDSFDGAGHPGPGNFCAGADLSCCSAKWLLCNDNGGIEQLNAIGGQPVAPGRIHLHDILTGPIAIVNNTMLYGEFDPDENNDGDVCADDRVSRIKAFKVDLTPTSCIPTGSGAGQCDPNDPEDDDCGDPILPGGHPYQTFDKSKGIVSAPKVDPTTGKVYVQFSNPSTTAVEQLDVNLPPNNIAQVRHWRQLN